MEEERKEIFEIILNILNKEEDLVRTIYWNCVSGNNSTYFNGRLDELSLLKNYLLLMAAEEVSDKEKKKEG